MKQSKNGRKRMLFVALVVGALSIGTYALTAANTVPDSKAGDGAGAITGYTVSAVDYTLNTTNPQNIDSVTFTLNSTPAAGSTVKIKLVSTGSTWYSCTMTGANAACTTTGATVATADELRVVAAD